MSDWNWSNINYDDLTSSVTGKQAPINTCIYTENTLYLCRDYPYDYTDCDECYGIDKALLGSLKRDLGMTCAVSRAGYECKKALRKDNRTARFLKIR
jgi:translation initiation factor 2 beta subunit (eIF-2beta)/eIF-5